MKNNKKLVISFVIVFVLINLIFYDFVFAGQPSSSPTSVSTVVNTFNGSQGNQGSVVLPAALATVIKLLLAAFQVGITGYFVIRFTLLGIRYFSSVAASEKANMKNELRWTFLLGVLAFLTTSLVSYLYDTF